MPYFDQDNIAFHYLDRGAGLPVVFQHGLGGDTERVFGQVELPTGFRLLGMDCRGHGKTKPLGEPAKLRFDTFADDLVRMLDYLDISAGVVGGTSMGAGVALNLALRYPNRVLGLALLRPAWLDRPNEANVTVFGSIVQLLRQLGSAAGRDAFKQTEIYLRIAHESPDSAESLLALFSDPRALENIERLGRIPKDSPSRDRSEWARIQVPVLIMANRADPIHPFEYGRLLSEAIPGSQFKELTPKSINLTRYLSELRTGLADFLNQNFARTTRVH